MALDLGAMSVFLYTFTEREKLYNLFELLTGARFTTSYTRVGGQIRDLPEAFIPNSKNSSTTLVRVSTNATGC
jgi:NADH-quinone oxidoreductase subunit D